MHRHTHALFWHFVINNIKFSVYIFVWASTVARVQARQMSIESIWLRTFRTDAWAEDSSLLVGSMIRSDLITQPADDAVNREPFLIGE